LCQAVAWQSRAVDDLKKLYGVGDKKVATAMIKLGKIAPKTLNQTLNPDIWKLAVF